MHFSILYRKLWRRHAPYYPDLENMLEKFSKTKVYFLIKLFYCRFGYLPENYLANPYYHGSERFCGSEAYINRCTNTSMAVGIILSYYSVSDLNNFSRYYPGPVCLTGPLRGLENYKISIIEFPDFSK